MLSKQGRRRGATDNCQQTIGAKGVWLAGQMERCTLLTVSADLKDEGPLALGLIYYVNGFL